MLNGLHSLLFSLIDLFYNNPESCLFIHMILTSSIRTFCVSSRRINMNNQLSQAFSAQINKEYFSAFLYLAMSDYFANHGLKGAANWTYIQYLEELAHAQNMVHYLHARSETATFTVIADPSGQWNNSLDVFKAVLEHENLVTESIGQLATLAMQSGDHAAYIFLQWYISEQVEEESNVNDIIDKLNLANGNPNALLTIDSQLAVRTFVAPIVPGIGTTA
jgi:ferritin